MTHTGPVPESAGEFGKRRLLDTPCPKCGKLTLNFRVWESHDGGHEDEKYECDTCDYVRWVDGIDS